MKPKTSTEQGRASHPCAACGGSGDTISTSEIPEGQECGARVPSGLVCGALAQYQDKTKRPGDGMYEGGDTDAFLCPEHAEFGRYRPCPVCLGAGQLSDRMPARDAVADAETLRTVLYDPMTGGRELLELRLSAFDAEAHAREATRWPPPLATDGDWRGTLAARAAFKACPGLRG